MIRRLVALLTVGILFIGCSSSDDPVEPPRNSSPVITAGPTADPGTITHEETTTLSVTANDPNGDALEYAWTSAKGVVSGSGASVTYNPNTVTAQESHVIDLVITDGNGGTATGSVSVTVDPTVAGNSPPQVTSGPTASPSTITDSQTSTISVVATDPDGDALTYGWSAADGSISGSGASVTYDPNEVTTESTHLIEVLISDGKGGTVNGSVNVTVTPGVNSPPQIVAGPTASPSTIDDDATSSISVTATDANGDALSYSWSATKGTVTGSGSSVTFVPESVSTTSTGRVTVVVADGNGGEDTGFVDITINPTSPNQGPTITSGPTASPSTIRDTETSTLSVTATDPDGDPLTYNWTAANGSISGSGSSVTYNPNTVAGTTDATHRIDVAVTDGRGGSASSFVNVTVRPKAPFVLYTETPGETQEWTAELQNFPGQGLIYDRINVVPILQDEYMISGEPRYDFLLEADVSVENGTIDGDGNVTLTIVIVGKGFIFDVDAYVVDSGDYSGPNMYICGSYVERSTGYTGEILIHPGGWPSPWTCSGP